MAKKSLKRMAAFAMAAAMVASTPVGAEVQSGTGSGTSASESRVYYEQNVTTVVVPTDLRVAFNPGEFKISNGYAETTDTIVSRTVAIVNQGSKNKKVSVNFKISTSGFPANATPNFVDSLSDIDPENENYDVCLQLQAAKADTDVLAGSGVSGTTPIKVLDSGAGILSYSGATLAKAQMTDADSGTRVAISSGTSGTTVGFKLAHSEYDYPTLDIDNPITVGSGGNEVEGTLYNIPAGAYTAFRLTGAINTNADWSKIGKTASITITPTYELADVLDRDMPNLKVTSGTGALIDEAAVSEPEAAGLFYDAQNNEWWIGVTDSVGFDTDKEITSVKVNDQAIQFTKQAYGGKNFAVVKWADYVAAGYDQNETSYDFTVVVGGVTYAAHYDYE